MLAMAKKPVRYCVVDAFTDSAFKGNPAAVCLLEEERDEEWLQAVAREFNISETCYLTRLTDSPIGSVPRFLLRWFTPVAEVKLCGHATLAASHFLFSYDLVKSNIIEYSTLSGILTAKRVAHSKVSENGNSPDLSSFLIELDFPVVPIKEYDSATEINSTLCKSLNISSVKEIHMTTTGDDILDPVCGSAHCALAPYWSKKLGKNDLIAYQASPRSGVLNLHVDEKNQRVLLRGKAVVVTEGSILV